jgi:hypothetical protein
VALVFNFVVSKPVFGSVTAKQAFSLPFISGGRNLCLCSSLPNISTGFKPKIFICKAEAPLIPAPDSATACIISEASVIPKPAPPYFSGIAIPSQPSSANLL